jgi:hypothetical protein
VDSYQNKNTLLVSPLACLLLIFLCAREGFVYGSHGDIWVVVAVLNGADASAKKFEIDTAQSFSVIYARAALRRKRLELMESSRHGRAFRHRRGEASPNGKLQPQRCALFIVRLADGIVLCARDSMWTGSGMQLFRTRTRRNEMRTSAVVLWLVVH